MRFGITIICFIVIYLEKLFIEEIRVDFIVQNDDVCRHAKR